MVDQKAKYVKVGAFCVHFQLNTKHDSESLSFWFSLTKNKISLRNVGRMFWILMIKSDWPARLSIRYCNHGNHMMLFNQCLDLDTCRHGYPVWPNNLLSTVTLWLPLGNQPKSCAVTKLFPLQLREIHKHYSNIPIPIPFCVISILCKPSNPTRLPTITHMQSLHYNLHSIHPLPTVFNPITTICIQSIHHNLHSTYSPQSAYNPLAAICIQSICYNLQSIHSPQYVFNLFAQLSLFTLYTLHSVLSLPSAFHLFSTICIGSIHYRLHSILLLQSALNPFITICIQSIHHNLHSIYSLYSLFIYPLHTAFNPLTTLCFPPI